MSVRVSSEVEESPFFDVELFWVFQQVDDSGLRDYEPPLAAVYTDVVRVASHLGHAPSGVEYGELGRHSTQTVTRWFSDSDSWPEAMRELGFDYDDRRVTKKKGPRISDEDIRADIARVASELGHSPSYTQYHTLGEVGSFTLRLRSGGTTWTEVLAYFGFDPSPSLYPFKIAEDDIHADFARVVDSLGRPPTTVEYDTLGTYSSSTICRRTGHRKWNDALESLGYEYNPPYE
jgi:hypothetical protein